MDKKKKDNVAYNMADYIAYPKSKNTAITKRI